MHSIPNSILKLAFAACLGLITVAGCQRAASKTASPPSNDGLNIVCTTAQVADVVRAVGGDYVQVTSLMGAGDDPHSYLPKPREASRLNQADVIFYNGLHLEGRMADMLEKMGHNRPVYAVVADVEAREPKLLIATSQFDGHYDPHVWFDPVVWTRCVEFVADKLSEHAPQHREAFAAGAQAYSERLRRSADRYRDELAAIDRNRRVLVTAHDAFGYFGRAYDLEVHGLQGLSSADEASLGRINELVKMLVAQRVRAVFIESSVPPRHIETVIDECRRQGHEVKIGGELFSDAMGAEGTPEGTYFGMLDHNVQTILAALQ